MRAISWNVNGLRAAHKKGFLDWFNDESPDIMCLQETKAHAEQLPETVRTRSEEHTSELQSLVNLVCRLLLEKKNHPPPPPLSHYYS